MSACTYAWVFVIVVDEKRMEVAGCGVERSRCLCVCKPFDSAAIVFAIN